MYQSALLRNFARRLIFHCFHLEGVPDFQMVGSGNFLEVGLPVASVVGVVYRDPAMTARMIFRCSSSSFRASVRSLSNTWTAPFESLSSLFNSLSSLSFFWMIFCLIWSVLRLNSHLTSSRLCPFFS